MERPQNMSMDQHSDDDEIDLFELFQSLIKQWRWLVGLTLAGTVLALILALLLPSQYQATARVALPAQASFVKLNTIKDGAYSGQSLFNDYYHRLRSPEVLIKYAEHLSSTNKLGYRQILDQESLGQIASRLTDSTDIEVLEPKENKKDAERLLPTLVGLSFWSDNEAEGAEFLNGYLEFVNDFVLSKIINDEDLLLTSGIESAAFEVAMLRSAAKRDRLHQIELREAKNKEQLTILNNSIARLVEKKILTQQSRSERLKEGLLYAEALGIKKPTTIEALSKSGAGSQVNVTTQSLPHLFLLGSTYLKKEIESIESRANIERFVPEIIELKTKIMGVENDEILASLKARVNDDPFIAGLQPLLNKLNRLNERKSQLASTSDMVGQQIYRLDKKAVVDGGHEKPKRALIVAVGAVLSGFIAIFVALIIGAVKRRKELVL